MQPVETPCVCTTLRMATRTINLVYDAALVRAGLRATGYTILSRLATDGPLSISGLARRLALERTTCSRELQPLVDSGLVELRVGGDRRQRVAHITTAGARRLKRARPHWERAQEQVVEGFGRDETERLLTALRGLRVTAEQLAA